MSELTIVHHNVVQHRDREWDEAVVRQLADYRVESVIGDQSPTVLVRVGT